MPSQPQTLLGALQQLVAHAESHPENLLSRLKQLVSDACEGKLVSEPADSKTQTVNRHTTHRQQHTNIPRGETDRTWAQVAATHAESKCHKKCHLPKGQNDLQTLGGSKRQG